MHYTIQYTIQYTHILYKSKRFKYNTLFIKKYIHTVQIVNSNVLNSDSAHRYYYKHLASEAKKYSARMSLLQESGLMIVMLFVLTMSGRVIFGGDGSSGTERPAE